MLYYSKLIIMFAVFTPRTVVLVYKGTTFLCPNGSIMSQNIRLSNPTLGHRFFMNCMLVLGGTGRRQPSLYIYISNSFQLCQEQVKFAMLGIIVPVQQRPPTKRVSVSLQSTLTSISTVWELICKTSLFASLVGAVKMVLPSLVYSISVAFTIQSVPKIMITCWPTFWNATERNMLTIKCAKSESGNEICFHSSIVIRMLWYYRLTSLNIKQHIDNHYCTASSDTGCAECLYSKT